MARRFSSRRVKIHRTYTIAEVAILLGAHKHTVSRWIASGLPTTDSKRPLLIHGEDLRAFLQAREPAKQPCRPDEIYCLGCRAPKRPALGMADYIPRSAARGALCGICPTCGRLVYRAVNRASLEKTIIGLDVTFPKAERHLSDMGCALSNVELEPDR